MAMTGGSAIQFILKTQQLEMVGEGNDTQGRSGLQFGTMGSRYVGSHRC